MALAGQPVSSAAALEQLMARLSHPQRVPARIYRRGQTFDVTLDL